MNEIERDLYDKIRNCEVEILNLKLHIKNLEDNMSDEIYDCIQKYME